MIQKGMSAVFGVIVASTDVKELITSSMKMDRLIVLPVNKGKHGYKSFLMENSLREPLH